MKKEHQENASDFGFQQAKIGGRTGQRKDTALTKAQEKESRDA